MDPNALIQAVVALATNAAPTAFYVALCCVLVIDAIDLVQYRRDKGKLPTVLVAYHLLADDVANKAILTVAATAGLAYFAATGNKLDAARAVFVTGVVGSLAVDQQYLRAKLAALFAPAPPKA